MPKARDRLFLTKGAIKLASRTTFLCRCKPFKELFSLYASATQTEVFSRKRVQRYGKFRNPPNIFATFFSENRKFSDFLTQIKEL